MDTKPHLYFKSNSTSLDLGSFYFPCKKVVFIDTVNVCVFIDHDQRMCIHHIDGHMEGSERRVMTCLGEEQKFVDFCWLNNLCIMRESDLKTKFLTVTSHGFAYVVDILQNKVEHCLTKHLFNGELHTTHSVHFTACSSGSRHITLLDRSGSVWAWGGEPQSGSISRTCSKSTKNNVYSSKNLFVDIILSRIDFFEGFNVVSVQSGHSFCLVVATTDSHDEDGTIMKNSEWNVNSERSEEEPVTELDSSCPLGLPLDTVSERSSMSLDLGLNSAVSLLSEQQTSEVVMAQTGMYMNAKDAISYLSKHLYSFGFQSATTTEPTKTPFDDKVSESMSTTDTGKLDVPDKTKFSSNQTFKRHSSFSREHTFEKDGIAFNKACHSVTRQRSRDKVHKRSHSATIHNFSIQRSCCEKSDNVSVIRESTKPRTTASVWFWGEGCEGVSGQGDTLDRPQPIEIKTLTHEQVIQVACGRNHCLALTVRGTVFVWGENHGHQLEFESDSSDGQRHHLTPHLVKLPKKETACFVASHGDVSLILCDSGLVLSSSAVAFPSPETTGSLKSTCMIFYKKTEDNRGESKINAFQVVSSSCPAYVRKLVACEKIFLQWIHVLKFKVMTSMEHDDLTKREKHSIEIFNETLDSLNRIYQALTKCVQIDDFDNVSLVTFQQDRSEVTRAFLKLASNIYDCKVAGLLKSLDFESLKIVTEVKPDEENSSDEEDWVVFKFITHFIDEYLTTVKSIQDDFNEFEIEVSVNSKQMSKLCSLLKQMKVSLDVQRVRFGKTVEFWQDTSYLKSKLSHLKSDFRRRVILDSFSVPLSVLNFTRFGKSYLVLMSDMLVHVGLSFVNYYPLNTIWVSNSLDQSANFDDIPVSDADSDTSHDLRNTPSSRLYLIMPEETIVVNIETTANRTLWSNELDMFIQKAVDSRSNINISKDGGSLDYCTNRLTSYTFTKITELKGATYDGYWNTGKMHGRGDIEWADGRHYSGQMWRNQRHGTGKYTVKIDCDTNHADVYEGTWVEDKLNGYGEIRYTNGDIYHGNIKDNQPHGHGTFKQGQLDSGRSVAGIVSIYIGEWRCGMRSGYGVSDNISDGERYMGMWSHNVRSGPGCLITADGLYYEGHFLQDKLGGGGSNHESVLIFRDDTLYEGKFVDVGVFGGQGVMTMTNGDSLQGNFHGKHNSEQGFKFSGTIRKISSKMTGLAMSESIKQHKTTKMRKVICSRCVTADLKWKSIYKEFHDKLTPTVPSIKEGSPNMKDLSIDTLWNQLAIQINVNKNARKVQNATSKFNNDKLEIIPDYFNLDQLKPDSFNLINDYLTLAFHSTEIHPFGVLLTSLVKCFNSSYGGVYVHSKLIKHAINEISAIVHNLFNILTNFFPVLTSASNFKWLTSGLQFLFHSTFLSMLNLYFFFSFLASNKNEHPLSPSIMIHPFLLPGIHSSLFLLYIAEYDSQDMEYWVRIQKWNTHDDETLLRFLDVDKVLIESSSLNCSRESDENYFHKAVYSLQQIKTEFTPCAKIEVIVQTFKEIDKIAQTAFSDVRTNNSSQTGITLNV